MSIPKTLFCCAVLFNPVLLLAQNAPAKAAPAADESVLKGVREHSEKFAAGFNAAKVDDLANTFLAEGEYIDETGAIYQGRKEIKELLTAFFKQFPETKLTISVESARAVGPVVIEEGTRTMALKDGATSARFRFIAIWTKADAGWKIASFRDISDDAVATAQEGLKPLAWLVGDWVNEGADGSVSASFKWSEDKNFLLGEFQRKSGDEAGKKTAQRFGWDPSTGKIRVWLFEADGGFAEGVGAVTEEGLVVKFTSVNADGTTASATVTLSSKDKDRFAMKGTDRIVGDVHEADFEIDVVRRPPSAGK